MLATISLDGLTLDRKKIEQIVRGARVVIPGKNLGKVRASRHRIEKQIAEGNLLYGVNTGFGKLSSVEIPKEDIETLQLNLLRADMVGVGEPFPTDVVRAMMVLRISSLIRGYSGIREETLNLLVEMLNKGVHPVIPQKGSVGASGDLAPLAHMGIVLVGEGKAEYKGEVYPGREALEKAGLTPVKLQAKEGLALINGTQAMTAVGALALNETERLGIAADMATCLTIQALQGVITAYDKELLAVRNQPGIDEVGARLRKWLAGSERTTTQGELRMQDAYSLRCVPHVHGASWQAFHYVDEVLEREYNSTTDNPIVLDDGRVLSGGHFHGQPIALVADHLKVAAAEWASISERRTERLVNPQLSGLAPFLATNPGLDTGLMVAQYTAAALVSENKVLAHPSSVDSIPTSANQEDHVSMGTIGARQAREVVHNAARVIAIELICASQAIYLEAAEGQLSPVTRSYLEEVREICPPLERDQDISESIEELSKHVINHNLD